MHNRWHNPAPVSLWHRTTCLEQWEYPDLPGYVYEIEHVGECLRKGLIESPMLPWAFSRLLMQTMDDIRHSIGVQYPADGA